MLKMASAMLANLCLVSMIVRFTVTRRNYTNEILKRRNPTVIYARTNL